MRVAFARARHTPDSALRSTALTGLKQRLLSFLVLDALAQQQQSGSPALRPVQMFYRHFCSYQDLLVWRAHLLSSCQLVIQFAFPDARVRPTCPLPARRSTPAADVTDTRPRAASVSRAASRVYGRLRLSRCTLRRLLQLHV
jgi:hypothetical protein